MIDLDQTWISDKFEVVRDFPIPGVIFKSIRPILADPEIFRRTIDVAAQHFRNYDADCLCALDARGFVFGSPLAMALGCGFVMIRKAGKLPPPVARANYQLEYGEATIEIEKRSITPGMRVVLFDDVIATGGTLVAAVRLLRSAGADVQGVGCVVDLIALGGSARIEKELDVEVTALVRD